MSFKRGDVVLVLFPDSNLRTAKRRPVLVIQADGLNTDLPQTLVAMITSNMNRADRPYRVKIELASQLAIGTGLRTNSVIMVDNLATILHSEIDRKIGTLANMAHTDTALRNALFL